MIHGFPPIFDENCTVMILGTMPGAESLKRQQYYAYGKNQFWKMIAAITQTDFEDLEDYKIKKKILLQNHIALWDVLKSCIRENSSDSNIRIPEPNDFNCIFENLPRLRYICFNGKEAEKLFKRFVIGSIEANQYTFTVFPSTSPANTMKYEIKLAEWKRLKEYIAEE